MMSHKSLKFFSDFDNEYLYRKEREQGGPGIDEKKNIEKIQNWPPLQISSHFPKTNTSTLKQITD